MSFQALPLCEPARRVQASYPRKLHCATSESRRLPCTGPISIKPHNRATDERWMVHPWAHRASTCERDEPAFRCQEARGTQVATRGPATCVQQVSVQCSVSCISSYRSDLYLHLEDADTHSCHRLLARRLYIRWYTQPHQPGLLGVPIQVDPHGFTELRG